VSVGEAIARALEASKENVLLLTTSDLNHYEDDATTRIKDRKAIKELLALQPRGLYDTCRNHEISMCGLGPATAVLTALNGTGQVARSGGRTHQVRNDRRRAAQGNHGWQGSSPAARLGRESLQQAAEGTPAEGAQGGPIGSPAGQH